MLIFLDESRNFAYKVSTGYHIMSVGIIFSATDTIPLSALAELELQPEFSVIRRRNGRRVNLIQGFIAAGVLPSEVLQGWQQRLNDSNFELPSGYWLEVAGESEQQGNSEANLFSTLPLVFLLAASILVLSLNSFRATAIIGGVAICAIGLGFFSLWLFGYPFGFMSLIGTFGLVGVAINDSVVVLAAILEDPEASIGNRRAIRQVVMGSTRHVVATTLTTMIGFVPLLVQGGSFWPPLAVAVAGGVGGSTLVALYLVPCCYLLLANFGRGKYGFRVRSQESGVRSQESGVRSQESGVRSQESGVRSQEKREFRKICQWL